MVDDNFVSNGSLLYKPGQCSIRGYKLVKFGTNDPVSKSPSLLSQMAKQFSQTIQMGVHLIWQSPKLVKCPLGYERVKEAPQLSS